MSKGLNKVYLLGNLGEDPQLKHTALGTPYLRFRLATSERFKNKEEEWKDHTEWHSVILWGNRATGLSTLLNKGTQVMVEGTLRTTSYVKDGTTRFSTEVKAHDVCLARGHAPVGSARADDEGMGGSTIDRLKKTEKKPDRTENSEQTQLHI
jgi:single-strand DNA-binding protein